MTGWTEGPAYKQVADGLRRRIQSGEFEVGAALPSISQLMEEYQVSITVIRDALRELRSDKLISSHQGKGSYVRAVPPNDQPQSADFTGFMQTLDGVQEDIRTLAERVAQLESEVRAIRLGGSAASPVRPDQRP